MKEFFRRYKGRLVWLVCALALIGAFLLARSSRALMNAYARRVAAPLRRAVAAVTYSVRFSVMELVIALALAAVLVWVVLVIVRLLRHSGRGWTLCGFLLTAVCLVVTVYAGFCLLWGVYYYTDSFQDESGIRAEAASEEELYAVTRYFAAQLAEAADTVERDENGLFSVPRSEIFAEASHVYDRISAEIPCLANADRTPKAVRFSRAMSLLDFTGVYFPFTAESNLNVDSPACLLPATIAHELGHQRGIASEKECNFTAVLASTTSDSAAYRYSGWLLGYLYLGNALRAANEPLYQSVRDALPETVLADIADNNAYWAEFRDNRFTAAYQKVYDRFLKSYGQTAGVRTYGLVVDLLTVYYRDAAAGYLQGAA